jgi:molecular chaperone HtpG
MSNAAKQPVVDASGPFEGKLLEEYTKMDGVHLKLLHVDRVDDPNVFRGIAENDRAVERLAAIMAQRIRVGSKGAALRVEARRFDPPDLQAVLRTTERSRGVNLAHEMAEDPTVPVELREVARDLRDRTRDESTKLTINASNPFIRELAVADADDPDVFDVILGVYNNAILSNMEMMTPRIAEIFHNHFARLMQRNLEFTKSRVEIQKERAEIQREREATASESSGKPAHRIFFLMTPFDKKTYGVTHDAVRIAVEDHWHCQVFMASDETLDDRLLESVRKHMDRADAFIAEVSEGNPNVMFELGAVFHERRGRPIVLLRRQALSGADRPKLPADLDGLLYVDYDPSLSAGDLADVIESEMRKRESIESLLKDTEREHYISPRTVRASIGRVQLDDRTLARLTDRFPTRQAWAKAAESEVAALLDRTDQVFAGGILSLMKSTQP